ncbi:class II aldolase/adducin family protein [Agrococcus terreus]|uniref:Aldolase class 2 protein n=1 Tax=Agrococcus terreus TaxID=574649 RepID=A0ABQ2KCY6_9MICO|nr:class II aldolase/adducin family protein [Agrococcus terreus]GGN77937.1 putative aldolase class 2 protein [Agrococcus terreus]
MSELADAIVDLGRRLDGLGMAPGTSGNLSARDGDTIVVTPTGAMLGALDPDALSRISLAGEHLDGPRPTKESVLHAAVYQERPEARGIVHTHSPWALALSCLDDLPREDALPHYTPYYTMRVGLLPRVAYVPPGDAGLAAACAAGFAADARANAVLLDRHGLVAVGRSVGDAAAIAEELELAARLHFTLAGHAFTPLSAAEQDPLR